MCRRLLFISVVVLAVASVTVATQPSTTYYQYSYFGGGESTDAGRTGTLGMDAETSFSTGQNGGLFLGGLCGVIASSSNNGYIDQGASASGCGGASGACNYAAGGGTQKQLSYTTNRCGTCYPTSIQSQTIGGIAGQNIFNTCGTGGAASLQAGAASESQSLTTPSSGGQQYQYIAGVQGGLAYGSPTSYSSASGSIGGGATQCQTFGGIPVR